MFIARDPASGRRIDRSVTVRGSRTDAERELAAMVASVEATRAVGVRSTVSELLEAWSTVASTGWAPTTVRQTRSVLDRYLHPHLGRVAVGDVTAAMIDLRRPSPLWRNRWAAAVGRNDDPSPRGATRCIRAGGAVGMDLGQPS